MLVLSLVLRVAADFPAASSISSGSFPGSDVSAVTDALWGFLSKNRETETPKDKAREERVSTRNHPAIHKGRRSGLYSPAEARAENRALRHSGFFRKSREEPTDVEDSEEYFGLSKFVWVIIADFCALAAYGALVRYVAQFAKKKQDEKMQVPETVDLPADNSYGAPRQNAF